MASGNTTRRSSRAPRRTRRDPSGPEYDLATELRLLISSIRDYAIFMLDPEGRIESWNPGAERIKGYKAQEIIGRHFSAFYPEEDVRAGKPQHGLEVAAREGRFETEGWRLRKDGSRFWANVVITAVRDERGRLIGFGKVTRDLTERRAQEDLRVLNARLEEQRRQALEASRLKSQFLATMSHELRTPLNSVVGFAEVLIDGSVGPLNDAQRDYLGEILQAGRHLLQLINEILDLSRIEAGRATLSPQEFSPAEAIEEVAGMLAAEARRKGLHLAVRSSGLPPSATLDPQRFRQILFNLISNAVKYTPRGGRVEVRAGPLDADRFIVDVEDTGVGIKPEDMGRLFLPFERLQPGPDKPSGTGLGLALTKRFVELQGGSVSARSEPGRGSVFSVVLPARVPP